MMSNYNSVLQSNNTDLQTILNTINELPSVNSIQVAPSISVNSNGLITATAGTKSSTHQLAFQPAKTITPTTASQIAVSSGYYTGGDITVDGDSNLVAENIKSGVSIFDVNGTYEGSSDLTVVTGTFTPASDTDTITVTHNLGVVPKVILVFPEDAMLLIGNLKSGSPGANYNSLSFAAYVYGHSVIEYGGYWNQSLNRYVYYYDNIDITSNTANNSGLCGVTNDSLTVDVTKVSNQLMSAFTYRYIVAG